MKLFFLVLSFFFGIQAFAQYCFSGGPTAEIDSNLEWLMMNGENSSLNYTGCPGVLGVEHISNQSIYLSADSTYTIDCQFGTCGNDYAGSASIWIDFNQDETFDASELIGTWTGTPPVAASQFSFTVPQTISTGITRMRVTQEEGGTQPLDPCATFSWGSVTDFDVYLQDGIDCSLTEGLSADNAILVTSIPYTDAQNTSICFTNNHSIYNSPDVFYKIPTYLFSNSIDISTCQSDFDTHISILDSSLTILYTNDDAESCAPQSFLSIPVPLSDTIYLVVEGWGDESGNFSLEINEGTLTLEDISYTFYKLYPNPISQGKDLTFEDYNGTAQFFTLSGVLVLEESITANSKINSSLLAPGTYIVKLEDGSNIKLLVQ